MQALGYNTCTQKPRCLAHAHARAPTHPHTHTHTHTHTQACALICTGIVEYSSMSEIAQSHHKI